jgi:hypothetical protein
VSCSGCAFSLWYFRILDVLGVNAGGYDVPEFVKTACLRKCAGSAVDPAGSSIKASCCEDDPRFDVFFMVALSKVAEVVCEVRRSSLSGIRSV